MINKEFFAALEQLEKEKGIPVDYMLDRVGQALITAYKRENDGMTDNVYVIPDRQNKEIRMFVRKTVVDDVYEPYEELTVEEAREYKANAKLGDIIDIDIPTKSFGRIAAQTARQVIIQGMREAERGMVYDEFSSKEHEILTGIVTRIDPRSGAASLRIAALMDKPARRVAPLTVDYSCFQIPDAFVVGYGLDYNEVYRNLPDVGVLSPRIYGQEDE